MSVDLRFYLGSYFIIHLGAAKLIAVLIVAIVVGVIGQGWLIYNHKADALLSASSPDILRNYSKDSVAEQQLRNCRLLRDRSDSPLQDYQLPLILRNGLAGGLRNSAEKATVFDALALHGRVDYFVVDARVCIRISWYRK